MKTPTSVVECCPLLALLNFLAVIPVHALLDILARISFLNLRQPPPVVILVPEFLNLAQKLALLNQYPIVTAQRHLGD